MKKGLSTTMVLLVTGMVLLVSALLLIGVSQVTVDDAVENIRNFIQITGDTAETESLKVRCENLCQTACRTGDEERPGNLEAVPADETEDNEPIYCSEIDELGDWECVCNDENGEGVFQ